jgi:hypothetical protein
MIFYVLLCDFVQQVLEAFGGSVVNEDEFIDLLGALFEETDESEEFEGGVKLSWVFVFGTELPCVEVLALVDVTSFL